MKGSIRVLKLLSRREPRLLADHAWTTDMLLFAGGIEDHPVARDQLGGRVTNVRDGDLIGEDIFAGGGLRTLGEGLGLGTDADALSDGVGHGSLLVLGNSLAGESVVEWIGELPGVFEPPTLAQLEQADD